MLIGGFGRSLPSDISDGPTARLHMLYAKLEEEHGLARPSRRKLQSCIVEKMKTTKTEPV